MKDYYKILGVKKSASTADIKKRFRKTALSVHPDKCGRDTKDEFIELFEAYEILVDQKRRERYDLIYDWIDTPTAEQNDKELVRDILSIHEKGPHLFQVSVCVSGVNHHGDLDNWKRGYKS